MGLTFVPTPLGNLRDITLRALDVLRESDVIVAEDTRVTRKLLSAHDITGKELWTYHEHNARAVTPQILERAASGGRVAVVTDAGTPGISDPGSALVAAARERGIAVEVLPGPVAFVCAAVLSGFDLRGGLVFEGFAPRAAGEREAAFRRALSRGAVSVWYESPHRAIATLEALAQIAPNARIFLARELTKRFEQQILGTPNAVAAALERPVRGEIVIVLDAASAAAAGIGQRELERRGDGDVEPAEAHDAAFRIATGDEAALDAEIDRRLAGGASVSAIAKALAAAGAGERRHIYARITVRKRALRQAPG